MNKLKLESVMRLHGDTGTSLAKFLKMSRTTFSAKINETKGAEFTQGEIAKIRSKYNLSPSDVIEIFLKKKYLKKTQCKKDTDIIRIATALDVDANTLFMADKEPAVKQRGGEVT